MSTRIRWAILALSLAGLGFALASSWVHYRLVTDPTYVSPCDVDASFSCTQAYQSRFGSLGGVPTALMGVVWFGLVALIAGFSQPSEPSRPSVAAGYLFGLATVGLAVILYLAYASFFVLGTGCLLCIGTYVCVLGIFVVTAMTKTVPFGQLVGRLPADLGAALARPAALVFAILYLVGAGSAVAFFPDETTAAARAAEQVNTAQPVSSDVEKNFADAWAKQPRQDLGIPLDGAKVVLVKFNDYMCPSCRQYEEFYKPVLDKFAQSNPGAVKYIVKDFPWNSECNFNSSGTIPGHEAACDAAAAARMAKAQGKFDQMAAWLYANQGTSKAAVRAQAASLLGIKDFDREYARLLPAIRRDIADGGVLAVRSTPTYFLNGVQLPAMRPEFLELAIKIEIANAK